MNVLDFLIPAAHAQAAGAAPAQGGGLSMLIFPIVLIAVMYFVMIRPQMKRQKETKSMLEALAKGDEVVTAGGILGKVTKVAEQYVTVEIAPNTEITVQKSAVSTVLPKGTLKSL
jgi:preprotein translocase subunit YajC